MTNEHPTNDADTDSSERAVRVALGPFAGSLRSDAVWADPPPELGERIVAVVGRSTATPSRREAGLTRRTTRYRRVLLPAAAAVLAFVAGLLVARLGGGADGRGEAVADVALDATELAPDASAVGEVFDRGAGYALILQVDGLAPVPEGRYYEGWLVDGDDWVSVGTFHLRGGDGSVVLWSGVPVARYDRLVITAEKEGAAPAPADRYRSTAIVLDGDVALR